MSLLSQKDRELTIAAFKHYADYLNSEISYIEDSGLDYKEPSNAQNIYDRKTWLYQTFKEIKTIQDY